VKRAIPIKAIKALKELDLSMKPSLDFARDMFMFSFYTRGMSFVDMAYLRKTYLQNGILTYRRRKTGQELTIKWEKCMAEIVAKYPENKTDFLLPIIKEQGNGRNSEKGGLVTMMSASSRSLRISLLRKSPSPSRYCHCKSSMLIRLSPVTSRSLYE